MAVILTHENRRYWKWNVSRSRRTSPIMPVTTAESEKAYKARAHRAERAAVRVSLSRGVDPPSPRAFGDPWNGDKDGKRYRDNAGDLLRK
ncbi:hypothetical protein [Sphingomonas sp.]|uniref:hypothetical protein n=1 Tax=Sphingomonas sp. TaxID=28214 RepID=UPI0035BBF969